MPATHTFQLRLPRLVGVLLGSLLAIAAVLGATAMLALALAATIAGGLLRAWRGQQARGQRASDGRTIQVEYSVVGESQRGGSVPERGDLATKSSKELS